MKVKELLSEDIGNILHQVIQLVFMMPEKLGIAPGVVAGIVIYHLLKSIMIKAGITGLFYAAIKQMFYKHTDDDKIINGMKEFINEFMHRLSQQDQEIVNRSMKELTLAVSTMDEPKASAAIKTIQEVADRNKV